MHKDVERIKKAKHVWEALAKFFINSCCSYEDKRTPTYPLRPRLDITPFGSLGYYLFRVQQFLD